jgi:hypothetical protein
MERQLLWLTRKDVVQFVIGRTPSAELPHLKRPAVLAGGGKQGQAKGLDRRRLEPPSALGEAKEPDEEILLGALGLFWAQVVVGEKGRADDALQAREDLASLVILDWGCVRHSSFSETQERLHNSLACVKGTNVEPAAKILELRDLG